MKSQIGRHLALLSVGFLPWNLAYGQKIAIVADRLYSMSSIGPGPGAGVVLIEDGRITDVYSGRKIPEGYQVMHAVYATPGLIDTKTTTGISGEFNIPADQDQDESSDPNTADIRALDSFNPAERLVEFVNSYGVTTIQVAPGIVNPVAGQAAIFKTRGSESPTMTAEQLQVKAVSAIVFNLGESPKKTYGALGKAPGTRMMTAEIIRKAFLDAQDYQKKWDEWTKSESKDSTKQPVRNLKLEAVSAGLRGEIAVIFNAYREDDIVTALRVAKEFSIKPTISSTTEGYLIRDVLKASGAATLVGPTLQRLDGIETMNASLENAALLSEAGIPVGLMSGYEGYVPKNRVLLFEAGIAAANGLGFEGALRACTSDAARILGIEARVGSLEKGKDADVVLYDGDPFEYTSHVVAVIVNGKITYRQR